MYCEQCGVQDYVEAAHGHTSMVLCWDCFDRVCAEAEPIVNPLPNRLVAVVPTVVRDQFGDPARIHRYVDIPAHRLWWWLAQPAVQVVDRDCLLWHPSDDAFDHRS